MERHGEIVFLKELSSATGDLSGRSVRVTGNVTLHDPAHAVCRIEHEGGGLALVVDMHMMSPKDTVIQVGSLCQFIGDLFYDTEKVTTGSQALSHCLNDARISRSVKCTEQLFISY